MNAAEIKRAIMALEKAEKEVLAIDVMPDGRVRIIASPHLLDGGGYFVDGETEAKL